MKLLWTIFITLLSVNAFAINCDCIVRIYSPISGSHKIAPNDFKTYELEEFSSYSVKNQKLCRLSCLETFHEDMPQERLNALLLSYSQSLINEGVLGYNCTGLTVLKYPVRVKARLGRLGLGNVSDTVQVVAHEEVCF